MGIGRWAGSALGVALAGCSLLVRTDGLAGGDDGGTDANGVDVDGSGVDAADEARADADAGDPLSIGLVAWYRFEEASGVAIDSSGHGNDATPHGNVARAAGIVGEAATFDGQDAYFSAADSASLAVGDAYSVAAWIKLDAVAYDQRVLGNDRFDVKLNSRFPQMSAGGYAAMKASVPPNEWHHVTFVCDRGTLAAYLDGAAAAFDEVPPACTTGPSGALLLGTLPNPPRYFAKGALDEIRIYDRALTADIVAALATR